MNTPNKLNCEILRSIQRCTLENEIVYASRIPPRPIGGRRLGSSLFCGRQILQNKGQELAKSLPEVPGGIKNPCQEHREQQTDRQGPAGHPFRRSEGLSRRSCVPIWSSGGLFRCPNVPFWVPKASILRVPGRPEAVFCRFCSKFAEFMETIEKPRFSDGFSMISKGQRVSKSRTNLKKSSPECLGTPKNRAGWAGLARWVTQVAIVGPIGAQWGAQWR